MRPRAPPPWVFGYLVFADYTFPASEFGSGGYMHASVKKKIALGFGFALVVLMSVSVASYWHVTTLIDTTSGVAQTQAVRAELDDVPLLLARAEVAQQRYFLTGDATYRDQYHATAVSLKKEIEDLATLLRDDAAQRQPLRTLEVRAQQYLTALQQEIEQWKQHEPAVAAQNLVSENDIATRLEVQDLIDAMERNEQQLLRKREDAADSSTASTIAIIVFGNALAIGLVIVAGLFIYVNLTEQRSVKVALQGGNVKEVDLKRSDARSMLAHDMRHQLGVVLGYAEMLCLKAHDLDLPEAEDLAHLKTSVLTFRSLLLNSFDLEKIEGGDRLVTKHVVFLNKILRRVADEYTFEMQRHGLSLTFTIFLIDDHALFRESVARLLAAEPDFEVAGHCGTSEDALAFLQHKSVDIVLLDFDLGTSDGVHFLVTARQRGFTGNVLIITAGVTERDATELLRAGIAGIFLKQNSATSLTAGIREVMAGKVWLDQKFLQVAMQAGGQFSPEPHPAHLSQRERQVLSYVFEGLANKEIAARLNVSESAVKATLQQLFAKTGVRTRSQLVRIALEHYKNQI